MKVICGSNEDEEKIRKMKIFHRNQKFISQDDGSGENEIFITAVELMYLFLGHRSGTIPVPIPNTEVKAGSVKFSSDIPNIAKA